MSSTVTGNNWTTFDLGPVRDRSKIFLMVMVYLFVIFFYLNVLVQCQSLSYLLHNPEGWGLVITKRNIISMNVLYTIPSQMAYCTAIKTFGIFGISSYFCKSLFLPKPQCYSPMDSTWAMCKIHLSIRTDLTCKGLSIILYA